MANFIANSLTVAALSTDLATIHSLDTIAPRPVARERRTRPDHDSEGMKAVVTCNGTNNYWVSGCPSLQAVAASAAAARRPAAPPSQAMRASGTAVPGKLRRIDCR